jgi:hypothetical protein
MPNYLEEIKKYQKMTDSQEIWQYLEVLRKKPNLFFKKDNIAEKLYSLKKISELGLPSIIPNLIPFLKDENTEIHNKTCDTISELLAKVKSKNDLYETLKNCSFEQSEMDDYKVKFTQKRFTNILQIASLNRNGYIREKAVKQLSEIVNSDIIPFLIYRLGDWVIPVRIAAHEALKKYKSEVFLSDLIQYLPVLEWLKKVERTHLDNIYKEITDFIIWDNKNFVIDKYPKLGDKIRLIIAKNIVNGEYLMVSEVNLLINDKIFLVRNLLLTQFDLLTLEDIGQLLNDKSAQVRLETLYKLKQKDRNFEETAKRFLADKSASIRAFSRFILRGSIPDFALIYYDNLVNRRHILGSIEGLTETNGTQYKAILHEFWVDKNLKIKKASFLGITKLHKEEAYSIALEHLDSEFIGLRKIAIDFLSKNCTNEVLEKARSIYKNGNSEVKLSILKFFSISTIGAWASLGDLILGSIDANESVRNLSVEYIRLWKLRAINLFTKPTNDEFKRIIKIHGLANDIHEKRAFFKENPLKDLEFYIKR